MRVIVLIIVLITTGCGLLKNKVTSTDKSEATLVSKTETNLSENVKLKTQERSLQISENSDDRVDVVRLWPKGVFTYSLEKGFSGEADSMVVHGRLKTQQTIVNKLLIDKVYQGKRESAATGSMKQVSGQVHKTVQSSVSWKWVTAALVLVGIGLWLYRKHGFH